jgi:hypothetical protein
LAITNTNLNLLEEIRRRMQASYGRWEVGISTPAGLGGRAIAKKNVWRLVCWRNSDCLSFVSDVPFRHPEKKAKARLILRRFEGDTVQTTVMNFDLLRQSIRQDKELYKLLAEKELNSSRNYGG